MEHLRAARQYLDDVLCEAEQRESFGQSRRMTSILNRAESRLCDLDALHFNWVRLQDLMSEVERQIAAEVHHLRCCQLSAKRCSLAKDEFDLRGDTQVGSGI